MEPRIIWETQDALVVEKPAGMLVHPTAKNETGTLAEWLLSYFPELKTVGSDPARHGIVHRLDKDASGLILVARTTKALSFYQQQFKNHTVEKEYIVLVRGTVLKDVGEIDVPLARSKKGPMVPARKGEGRPATTSFAVEKRFNSYTLVRVETKTGRLHQVRAHMKAIGHPVVGDSLYSIKRTRITASSPNRLFLHASELTFTDLGGNRRTIKSPLPKELGHYLNGMAQAH